MSAADSITLYSFYRSSCAFRVRIALELKKIPYTLRTVNIDKHEQKAEKYLKVNPSGLVPSLVTADGSVLTESLAILDYLENAFPGTYILWPTDPVRRARAIAISLMIIAGTQPLQNLRCIDFASELAGRDVTMEWSTHFIQKGLTDVERLLRVDDEFCIGDDITIADVCLVPQVYNAIKRTQIDVKDKFPKIHRISAAYRVRIALAHKDIKYETVPVNLLKKEHQGDEYKGINPSMLVPTLVTPDGLKISQSLAILDYLDNAYPTTPKIIPEDTAERAAALSIALTIACDTHPLQNLSVFQYANEVAGKDIKNEWVAHFIRRGLSTVEDLLPMDNSINCVGKCLSIADVCLVPQVYNALRFELPIDKEFPKVFSV
ncbi:hypothetical protein FOL47_010305 [Perkinsus chesapeaki]|uniref:Maleylacetoacetate isomerase n=1 Tax=Perkinsus chesapeaki TaxID=330153 RepID=A0A7J6MPU4_PERCH|nr:hypothetical protein FOL47_010305 [Perkinsus chesapeaki]